MVVQGLVDEALAIGADGDRTRQSHLDIAHTPGLPAVIDLIRGGDDRDAPECRHIGHGPSEAQPEFESVTFVRRCRDRSDPVGQERCLQSWIPFEPARGDDDGIGEDRGSVAQFHPPPAPIGAVEGADGGVDGD